MESYDWNKIAGAAIGSLLVFLLLGFAANKIYYGAGDDHGERTLAFALEIEEDGAQTETAEAEAAPPVSLASLVAEADPAAGEKVYNQCRACHKIEDGANGVGPHLYNVMGREIASVDGYGYSDALSGKEGVWDVAAMSAWLENPQEWAPGTTMGYSGLEAPEDRVNLMAYLNQESGDPTPLSELVEEEAETAEAAPAEEAAAEPEATEMAAADTSAEPAGEEAATEEAPAAAEGGKWAALLANASADNGEKVYRQCQACHKVQDGVNGVGPHLWGVVGREIASVDGYSYSDALSAKEGVWNLDELMAWLGNPGEYAPGNKMGYALQDEQDRIDVITYLNEADGTPEPLGGSDDRADAGTAGEGETETAAADTSATDASGSADAAASEETGTEVAAADTGAEPAAAEGLGQYAGLFAEASVEAGEKVFNRCRACHKVEDGVNGVGPHLWNVVGREIASVEGYSYSNALANKDGVWNVENLMEWLGNPAGFAAGNKMGYALTGEQDRANVIKYLNAQSDDPVALQ